MPDHKTAKNLFPEKIKRLCRKFKQKNVRKGLYELFGFWKYNIP